jgi:hypothetical protein
MRWTRHAASCDQHEDERHGADVKSCGPGVPVLAPAQCAERALSQTGAIKPVPGETTYKR